jgi:hypothetical protein
VPSISSAADPAFWFDPQAVAGERSGTGRTDVLFVASPGRDERRAPVNRALFGRHAQCPHRRSSPFTGGTVPGILDGGRDMDMAEFFSGQQDLISGGLHSAVLAGLQSDDLRRHPPGQNSIAWLAWHTARWQDVIAMRWVARCFFREYFDRGVLIDALTP